MNFYRGVNLDSESLKKIVQRLMVADHYEYCRVKFDEPVGQPREYRFQAGPRFIRDFNNSGIGLEQGKPKMVELSRETVSGSIVDGKTNDFAIPTEGLNRTKFAIQTICLSMLENGGQLPIYPIWWYENSGHKKGDHGIMIRLQHKAEERLLLSLLADGFIIRYLDFDWTPVEQI
jgi:hypothetical protein